MKSQLINLVILITLACASMQAQSDSLRSLLKTDLADTTRIDVLGDLSRSLFGSNPDSAIHYSKVAADISQEIGDKERLALAYKNIGLAYYYKGDYVEVLDYWEESLATYQSIDHKNGEANLLSNIGAVYYSQGDNAKAIEYYIESIRIAEKAGDDFRIATVLQNIGAIYESTQEYQEAEKYLIQAFEICKAIDYKACIGMTSLNLGEVYYHQGQDDLSSFYLENARDMFTETEDNNYLPNSVIMIGKLQTRQGKYTEALKNLNDAFEMAEANEGKLAMAAARVALGELYVAQNRPQSAVPAFTEAMEIAMSIGALEELRDAYVGMTKTYRQARDYSNTVRFQDSLIKINKEIYDLERNKQLEGLQLSYSVEKKDAEIQLLSADNEIKSQQIARANLVRNFFISMAGLLLLIAAGIAYQYRYIKKTNKIITEEKDRSNKLLLNILPQETAEELKTFGFVKARKYRDATVLFTDFVDFTGQAKDVPPEELVKSINYFFTAFDEIINKYNLEKIKTIGDAYMCAGGIPQENENNTHDAIKAAMEIVEFVEKTAANPPEGITPFKIRVGINSGPLVAGVVGSSKFQYDVWGDTVNIASRMESASSANQINVSHNVFEKLKDKLPFEYRGEIAVKNRGKLKMYFLDRAKSN